MQNKCQICEMDIGDERIEATKVSKYSFSLCGWCEGRVLQYIQTNITHSTINIYWGVGHIGWSCWMGIRKIIREHDIKEVLEYGTGLSTELFVNEDLKVTSVDILEQHSKLYQNHQFLKNKATMIWYPDSDHLPTFDRQWDFVFVDGPQERAREVKQAMTLSSKFIFLHDPNMGEQDFFPNEDWIPTRKSEPRLFIRKDKIWQFNQKKPEHERIQVEKNQG